MSGSAALPSPIREGWSKMSNKNILLERYGMTEVGMALSCGIDDADRVENSVGWGVGMTMDSCDEICFEQNSLLSLFFTAAARLRTCHVSGRQTVRRGN
jgi:hypothetical protein